MKASKAEAGRLGGQRRQEKLRLKGKWSVGRADRGMGRYSYAVMQGANVVVECSDSYDLALQIVSDHEAARKAKQ